LFSSIAPTVRDWSPASRACSTDFGANITHADQHRDAEAGLFFMPVESTLDGFYLDAFRAEFETLAAELPMQWQLKSDVGRPASRSVRVAVPPLPGRHSARQQSGELRCSIPLVISNHRSAEALANFYGVAFHHVPVTPDIRRDAQGEQRRLLTAGPAST
jgi:formyltetrahydrofolate deformylase